MWERAHCGSSKFIYVCYSQFACFYCQPFQKVKWQTHFYGRNISSCKMLCLLSHKWRKKGNKQMGVRVVVNAISSNDNHALKNKVLTKCWKCKVVSRLKMNVRIPNRIGLLLAAAFFPSWQRMEIVIEFWKVPSKWIITIGCVNRISPIWIVVCMEFKWQTDYAFDVNFIIKSHVWLKIIFAEWCHDECDNKSFKSRVMAMQRDRESEIDSEKGANSTQYANY